MEKIGIVEAVSNKEVDIKRGPRAGSKGLTHSIKMDDGWYNLGFKKAPNKGDEVRVIFTEGAYGKQVDKIFPMGSSSTSAATPSTTVVHTTGFPLGPRDKGRAINRQNALTNAVSFVPPGATPEDVIEIARKFEEYTTGDLDVRLAKAMLGDSAFDEENAD